MKRRARKREYGVKKIHDTEKDDGSEKPKKTRAAIEDSSAHNMAEEEQGALYADATRILNYLETRHSPRVLNILVTGARGVGKSALVNSCLMALNSDGYREAARTGAYKHPEKGYVSIEIKRYDICKYIRQVEGSKFRPIFWDCPGFGNRDDEDLETLLELLVQGRIDDSHRFENIVRTPSEILKYIFPKSDNNRKIDIIVVVQAATSPVPTNLLTVIDKVATKADIEVPVFVVVTKMDILKGLMEHHDEGDETSKELRLNHQQNIENMCGLLGLLGARNKVFEMSLYCQDVTPDYKRDKDVDENICTLWNMLLNPIHHRRVDIRDSLCHQS